MFCIPQVVLAEGAGTHLASFLEVDAGARQVAMGGAFTGLADDAMSAFYNPAGLKFLEGSEIHINSTSWAAGLSFQHLSYGFRHSYLRGVFAFSWSVMQMSPYDEKTEYYDPDSEFGIGILDKVDAGDMAFGASYCWDFGGGLSVGTTLRWYHLGMADAFCEGMTGDVGVLYETRFRNLRLGASALNLGPQNRWARTGSDTGFGEDYPLPTTYRVGASMRVYDVVTHRVVIATEYKLTADGVSHTSAGAEYTFHTGNIYVFGRGGYRYDFDDVDVDIDADEGLTLGLGLLFPTSEASFRLDYAYVDLGALGSENRFAVAFLF